MSVPMSPPTPAIACRNPRPIAPTSQTSSENTGSSVWYGIAKIIGTVPSRSRPSTSLSALM